MTALCEIMGRYGSDKGHSNIDESWHNYTCVYYDWFKDIRSNPLRVFELGVGTTNLSIPSNMGSHGKPGASLRGWAEFFPNARIFGADIDTSILFQTDRVHTFFCDQTNPDSIASMWDSIEGDLDIILDDGLHELDANVCFFENSIHKLKVGGWFVIEDIRMTYEEQWTLQLEQWRTVYPTCDFEFLRVPSNVNSIDNNLIIVRKMKL